MKINRFSLILVGLSLLIGCASVERARQAQDISKIPPGERTVTASEVGLTQDTDLTLERGLEIASTYHPSLVQARLSLINSDKDYSNAVAGYLPKVSARASSDKSTSNSSVKDADNKSDTSYSAGLSVDQLVYDFGKTPAAIREAYENKVASEASLRSIGNTVIYNVREAYYNLSKQAALVNVAQETVKQYEVHLDQTRTLVEVGRRIKYDITKAEVNLGNARIDLVNARNNLRTARAELNNALGLGEDPGYKVKDPVMPELKDYNLQHLVEMARAHQPELVAQIARERAASAAVDNAIADLFPSLSVDGGYSWSGDKLPLVWNWSLGALVNWTIFNGFQKTNQIDKTVANLRSARATKAEIEQKIYLDLTRAVAQLESASERLKLTDLIVKQAEEALNLVDEQYKIGKASSVEVTDAQVSLTQAQVEQIQARFDYQTAVALINKTVGEK